MSRSSTFLILSVVLLLAMLAVPGAAGAETAPIPIAASPTGSGSIYAGQPVWHGADCPAPTGMSPVDGGSAYTCPPAVKLPYPAPQRRPIPIRWP